MGVQFHFPSLLSCELINLQQAGEMQLAVNRAIVGCAYSGQTAEIRIFDGSGDERKPSEL